MGLFTSSAFSTTVSQSIGTTSGLVIAANYKRRGLSLYNNSANTIYISFTSPASSSLNMVAPIATYSTWAMPDNPVYLGAVYGIRNAGSGTVIVTELL